jgi:hypothetical protein
LTYTHGHRASPILLTSGLARPPDNTRIRLWKKSRRMHRRPTPATNHSADDASATGLPHHVLALHCINVSPVVVTYFIDGADNFVEWTLEQKLSCLDDKQNGKQYEHGKHQQE